MPDNLVFRTAITAERNSSAIHTSLVPIVRDQINPLVPPSGFGGAAVRTVVRASAVEVAAVEPVVRPMSPSENINGEITEHRIYATGDIATYDYFHWFRTKQIPYVLQYNDVVPVPSTPTCTLCGSEFDGNSGNVVQRWECAYFMHQVCYDHYDNQHLLCGQCSDPTLPRDSIFLNLPVRTLMKTDLPAQSELDNCHLCLCEMSPTDPLACPWLCAGPQRHWVHTDC
jgi:hypothetical protein